VRLFVYGVALIGFLVAFSDDLRVIVSLPGSSFQRLRKEGGRLLLVNKSIIQCSLVSTYHRLCAA